jgi:Holliday junction resolvasome RuvABC endonuclease subunit
MLPIPSDPNTIVSIIGIDPGSTNLGCAILSFDILTNQITCLEAYTFRGERLPGSEWTASIDNDRRKRITALEDKLFEVFMFVNPICIACESAFINVKRPSADGALTEVVCAIRSAVARFDIWRVLRMVAPSSVKNAVGAMGGGDKDAVKKALLNISELTSVVLTPITEMDEHSVDAIAVAYAGYKMLIESKFEPLI